MSILEIRTLSLKPGTRNELQRTFIEEALPLLQQWDFDVVAHGPSLHDENTYYVIRRFESVSQREHMEDTYYASDDWRKGPRERILALIEIYLDVVFEVDDAAVQGLRTSTKNDRNDFIEIRSYTLKPGTRAEFHRLFLEGAMPLLQRWNMDVVAYSPSLHDENSYYLIRRFDSLAHRQESEDAFYNSDEWRQGPRESIIALIENYAEVVLDLDDATVSGFRNS
jgi:hypothetical protein